MMETDGIIEADADIEQVVRQRLERGRQPGRHQGENASLAAGGISTHSHWDEDTPLLKDGNTNTQTSSTLEDDEATAVIWAGNAEFDDLPWYKRPSVSTALPFKGAPCLRAYRFTGCSRHLYSIPLRLGVSCFQS